VEPIDDLRKKLGSADEEERRLAVCALASFPLESVRDLAFAALGDESWRVRKEAVDLILSFTPGEQLSRDLISLLSVQGNAGLRNAVVEVLQTFGNSVLPQLVDTLGHDDPGVRKFIVDILGGIGDASVIPDLAAVLGDEDPNVAAAAAESLGLIGDEQSLPLLLNALDRDEFLLRYAILEALVKIGRPVPLEVITPLAANPLLKKALFECIGIVGNPDAVKLLIEGLHDRARNVREAALVALHAIRRRFAGNGAESVIDGVLRQLAGSDAVEYLMSMSESQDKKIKSAAIAILGAVGDLRAIDLFLREYRDENMQPIALQALRDMGAVAGELLYSHFESADDEGRCIVAHIAGELCLPECARIAAAGLNDPVPMVRSFAAEAIGKAAMTDLIPNVIELLNDVSADVRRRATGALVRLAAVASESVASAAIPLADADNPDCRLQAVRLLAALRDTSHLSLMSKDEDPRVRREAVSCLGELRSPDSSNRLAMALADEDPDVRVAAATALSWPGFADESHSLLLALNDSSPRVQVAALKSLGRRQQVSALKSIISLLQNASGMLRISALQALFQISRQEALPHLRKAEQDADPEVARVARGLIDSMAENV
jgi:HEAT repeat protein